MALLASCTQNGIVVVLAAGNGPILESPYQGWISPQRFATPNNAIISVGSIDRFGGKSSFNLPTGGPSADGSLLSGTWSVYALGEDIRIPNINPADPNLYSIQRGTSLSAPMVAGLPAYYLTLPNTVLPAEAIRVPVAIVPFNETEAIDPEAACKVWILMGMDPDEFSAGE
ncbi:MAG: hypothetical protein Q9228_002806 [Teloschistes exilis]